MRLVGRLVAIVVLLAAGAAGGVSPSAAADQPIIVWADPAVAPALRDVLATTVNATVVAKRTPEALTQLADVSLDDAPDLIWLPNAASGTLAARGLIDRLPLGPALRERFPTRVLDGFRYGFAYYGLPIRYSNLALIVNTDLVPGPTTTFTALERRGLRLVADGRADMALAVGQGSEADGAALYPLLSGLGGYLFGRNAAGSLDPYNVGIACPVFLANAERIDEWNDTGFLSAKVSPDDARAAFLSGRAPYWIAGPDEAAALDGVEFDYDVRPVPPIVDGVAPAPLLKVEGVAVTTYARERGTLDAALAVVRKVLARPDVQATLAAAGGLAPGRTDVRTDARTAKFAQAGAEGTAVPNIPQAAALWPLLDDAWANATGGATAVPARNAFLAAHRAVLAAVG